jgi:hydroxymethylbilane synthase
MGKVIRIGTRESQLAVWQATLVQQELAKNNFDTELVFIKSEGDIDLQTPLYEMGVQGIFTKSLDIALINNKIDIAVHAMKDVPTQLAKGVVQSAVLKRASYKDLLVYKGELSSVRDKLGLVNDRWLKVNNTDSSSRTTHLPTAIGTPFTVATSSIRRKAQWLNRYPDHSIENLRGNVNTRLRKMEENKWDGAIFAAAGLERINLRPENSIELDWMLPAPAQGAIMIVCREKDDFCLNACKKLNDTDTALCTRIERDFLRALSGGCSTPISALAEVKGGLVHFRGNILSPDGKEKAEIDITAPVAEAGDAGTKAANQLLTKGGQTIADKISNEGK